MSNAYQEAIQAKQAANQQWLDSLKPGDEVAYRSSIGYSGNWIIKKIDKRTKSGWIVTESWTFDANGRCRGRDKYGPVECVQVTQKIIDEIEKNSLVRSIEGSRIYWSNLPLEILREVAAKMKEWQKKPDNQNTKNESE